MVLLIYYSVSRCDIRKLTFLSVNFCPKLVYSFFLCPFPIRKKYWATSRLNGLPVGIFVKYRYVTPWRLKKIAVKCYKLGQWLSKLTYVVTELNFNLFLAFVLCLDLMRCHTVTSPCHGVTFSYYVKKSMKLFKKVFKTCMGIILIDSRQVMVKLIFLIISFTIY